MKTLSKTCLLPCYRNVLFFCLALLFFPGFTSGINPAQAQQNTLATFIVTDARINGSDVTDFYVDGGGYIVFYETEDHELYMANVLRNENTQSYGRLSSLESVDIEETDENYAAQIYTFRWSYVNDYDNKRGTASVRLTKIYKPVGIAFSCKIIPENLDVLEYRGYMEGSIDFSDY